MRDYRPLVVTSRRLALLVSFSVACVVPLTSCKYLMGTGEDSWQHYESGGMFTTTVPSLSPDGQYLAYASACTGHGDIYLIKSGASDPVRLTDSQDFESSPLFTPDGKRIVFSREREHRRHVWIMDSDGSNVTQLTKGNTIDDPDSFSHDGRYLLFRRAKPSMGMGLSVHTYVMRVDQPVGKPMSVGCAAVFSGDSRFVVYSEDLKTVWRMELDGKGSTRRQIGATGCPLDVSRDGKRILTSRLPPGPWTSNQDIWVSDAQGNGETLVANGDQGRFLGPKSEVVLYFVGTTVRNRKACVTTVDGQKTTWIKGVERCCMVPRVCLGGRGAVFLTSMTTGRPDYDVVFMDFVTLQTTMIASISCGGCTFQTPATAEETP